MTSSTAIINNVKLYSYEEQQESDESNGSSSENSMGNSSQLKRSIEYQSSPDFEEEEESVEAAENSLTADLADILPNDLLPEGLPFGERTFNEMLDGLRDNVDGSGDSNSSFIDVVGGSPLQVSKSVPIPTTSTPFNTNNNPYNFRPTPLRRLRSSMGMDSSSGASNSVSGGNSSFSLTPYVAMQQDDGRRVGRKRKMPVDVRPKPNPKLVKKRLEIDSHFGRTEEIELDFEVNNFRDLMVCENEDGTESETNKKRVEFVKSFNNSAESAPKRAKDQNWTIEVWVRMNWLHTKGKGQKRRWYKRKRVGIFLKSDSARYPNQLCRVPVSATITVQAVGGNKRDKVGTFFCDYGKRLFDCGFEDWIGDREMFSKYWCPQTDSVKIRVTATIGERFYPDFEE